MPTITDRPKTEVLDPKTANVRYHDWEASQYDQKWGITFDQRVTAYAREKFLLVAPERPYGTVLEIGAGTGFFVINLALAGLVEDAHATDISPGMVEACLRNAAAAGIPMTARTADAEALPFEDGTFDTVLGHAVLHHLPDVEAALAEAYRVLKPGGTLVIAGEPTRIGFRIVDTAKKVTGRTFRAVGGRLGLLRERAEETDPDAELEAHVDLHEFHPRMVERWAREAGFANVRVRTEELLSGVWGWSMRTIEAMAKPGLLPRQWPYFAYSSYISLYRLDNVLVRRLVPRDLFYNLLLYGEKPAETLS
ncbi:MAG TPA: class I SAM-dependent methyltransferase [Actinomycetota bacterium]